MNKLKRIILSCLSIIILFVIIKVSALDANFEVYETPYCDLQISDNGTRFVNENEVEVEKREISVTVNDISPGKRIAGLKYCFKSANCEAENNWHDVNSYDESNTFSSLSNSVGSNDIFADLLVPKDKINIRADFEDFEPMDISFAEYKLTPEENAPEDRIYDIYHDGIKNLSNYDETFIPIVTGYKGGDIILPNDCTKNGCLLKVTFKTADYNNIINRLNYFNHNMNMDMEDKPFVDLASMNNHIDNLPIDTAIILTNERNETIIDNKDDKTSIYLIINKFFDRKNRTDFIIGDNKNRILSEDYLGLKYQVDRKYFDEGNNYGFLTFNDYNDYIQEATIFYGTPRIQLMVDSAIPVSLTETGNQDGMGRLKNVYTKIISEDQIDYPIDNNYQLTIKSFYEPDYRVPIILKDNDDKTIHKITLNLSRFAFGGNAGGLLLVDDQGINCRQQWNNPQCREDNIYVSTTYRGLYDTFYSNGEHNTYDIFTISNQRGTITGDFRNETVYKRNKNFNPWAVAIFYNNENVIATRSFNLGELVKIEGYSKDVIANEDVNNIARTFGGELITDYNSANYTLFGYGLGYEKPINSIEYFNERTYESDHIEYQLILASKQEILDNNITRIALFLTNGELKDDDAEFPELTYGVGEGKIFEIDGRVFEELGGQE